MTSPRPSSTSIGVTRKTLMKAVIDEPSVDSPHPSAGDNDDKKRPCKKQHSRPAKRRLVTFNNAVRVSRTLHINSYSHAEIDACWYSQREYTTIRENAWQEANSCSAQDDGGADSLQGPQHSHYPEQQRCQEKGEAEECCVRGVECFTRRGARQKLKNKISGRNAVLYEQGLQWDEGVYRPEDIAEVYKLAASNAKAKAIRAARKDQVHARLLLWCI
mmetsp:Transcript_127579/g.190166  ORF Transcript_127579/g.190166 Transcript_127579/m.190166 type:complete len:217 (-) Transcript_127579:50-700(-)